MKPPSLSSDTLQAIKNSKKTKKKKKSEKTYKGKSMRPGGGGRFAKLKDKLESEGKSSDAAGAIAASVGRKKYGAKKMASWSAKARK